ncbi:ATP-binding protein [Candidatus Phytoplasma tritici]|uniref:ATP-binding protein n=1 Tax=Candidatus Phytoplasma tritici TaxID=321961 RepID=UPI000427FF41|nr:ATP-binding protein [Candidatus Phytoplasma tritici]
MEFSDIKIKISKMIAQCEETKNLDISDDDLPVIYNYLLTKDQEDEYGNRQKIKTNPLRVVWVPTVKSQSLYFKEHWQSQNELFDSSINFDAHLVKQFVVDNDSKQQALKEMKQIIKHFEKSTKGFYLSGSFNTGKTIFLKKLAYELIQKQISVIFLFMPDITRKFRNFLYNNTLETRLQQLKNVKCLILDDLGSENMTPWFRDEIFLPLLYDRAEKKLPLFISSNLPPNELHNYLFHLHGAENVNSEIKVYKIIEKIRTLTHFYDFSEKQDS